jgi:hypothetical protein
MEFLEIQYATRNQRSFLRSSFLTSATVHIRLGLAPEGLQVGDKIAILHGSRTLHIKDGQRKFRRTQDYFPVLLGWLDVW